MVLTTAEVALGAPAIAVAGTLLGAWIQSRRDERRTAAEREQERLRWEREDRLGQERRRQELAGKWADDRRAAYAQFLQCTREWRQLLSDVKLESLGIPTAPLDLDSIRERTEAALADLELIAGQATRSAATDLYGELYTQSMMCLVGFGWNDTATAVDPDTSKWVPNDEALRKLTRLREDFLALSQSELGTSEPNVTDTSGSARSVGQSSA